MADNSTHTTPGSGMAVSLDDTKLERLRKQGSRPGATLAERKLAESARRLAALKRRMAGQ
jgi:hypothetical protein